MADGDYDFRARPQQLSAAELEEILRVAPPADAMFRVSGLGGAWHGAPATVTGFATLRATGAVGWPPFRLLEAAPSH